MRFLIAVHDLVPEKSHLMPWRTVCEVTRGLRRAGHEVDLISLVDGRGGELGGGMIPDGTRSLDKRRQLLGQGLAQAVKSDAPDLLFWPLTWREPAWRLRVLSGLSLPKVGWFPGQCYAPRAVAYALWRLGPRKTLPYLAEVLSPRGRKARSFRAAGIVQLLTMTQATRDCAVDSGWPASAASVVPPGREQLDPTAGAGSLPEAVVDWLDDKPFFLFLGPPAAIRGVHELLDAFARVADQAPEARLVCLFRADGELDRRRIEVRITGMQHRGRVHVCWESVPASTLGAFLTRCHAAVMPFVLVPSEIPLAVIETARWGKPVITTGPGGTADYVAPFGETPRVGDVRALADAMLGLLRDPARYREKCEAARRIYLGHPDWAAVATGWGAVAQAVIDHGQ